MLIRYPAEEARRMQAFDLTGHLIPGTSAAGWRIGTRLAECSALTHGATLVEYRPGFDLVNAINANEGVLLVRDSPRGSGHITAYVGHGVVTFRFNRRGELYEVAVADGYKGRAFDRIGIGSPLDEVRSLFPVFYDGGDEMYYPDGELFPDAPSGIAFYASETEEPGSTPILVISVHDWDVMRREVIGVESGGPAAG
jgi:hypothetical protein